MRPMQILADTNVPEEYVFAIRCGRHEVSMTMSRVGVGPADHVLVVDGMGIVAGNESRP